MNTTRQLRRVFEWTAAGLGMATASYAACVATAWFRYGKVPLPRHDEIDPLLDTFLPEYEVAERHHVRVAAPPALTLSAAADADLQQSALVRAIFRARELALGAQPEGVIRPAGLLAQMLSLGWRVLSETPGEVVVGAVTRPWLADVTFRGLAANEFRAFREPGYVKIAWTLRADPVGSSESILRTETRVATTDATARAKFRWYWARFSPGIALIRRMLLWSIKNEAERRARLQVASVCPTRPLATAND